MGERLNHVDTEIGGLRGEIGELRNHVDTAIGRIEERDSIG
jgi:hypothetical protein